jgi:hypothetical protein
MYIQTRLLQSIAADNHKSMYKANQITLYINECNFISQLAQMEYSYWITKWSWSEYM